MYPGVGYDQGMILNQVNMIGSRRSVLIGIVLVFSGNLFAGPYLGVGASLLSADDSFDEAKPVNAFLRAGLALNRHFEIGGELSYTLIEDDVLGIDYDVDTRFIFLQANIVMNSGTKLYFMVGRSEITITSTSGPLDIEDDDTGTGYGIGLQFPGAGNSYGAIDYINYYDRSEFDDTPASFVVDGINFSYITYFD